MPWSSEVVEISIMLAAGIGVGTCNLNEGNIGRRSAVSGTGGQDVF